MKKIILSIVLFIIIVTSGCILKEGAKEVQKSVETQIVGDGQDVLGTNPNIRCMQLCNERKTAGVPFSTGPCLSNNIYDGWVCDVAHDPRVDVDNLPENQCEAYRNGTATHFVEVDTDCNLIRAR